MDESCIINQDDYVVEELSSMDVSEAEMAQFEEMQPLEVVGILPSAASTAEAEAKKTAESESVLIKKFVSGEVDFPKLFTKFENEEQLENVSDDEPEEDREPSAPVYPIAASPPKSPDADTFDDNEMGTRNRGRAFRKRSVLSGALQGLMGEANLSFARGQVEKAEKICLEIIRQNPLAPEPFFTLAEIYENRDKEKYLNFLIIAAHLNPGDLEQAIRIAEMFKARKDYAKARSYYSRAIKYFPKNYELRLHKGRLCEEIGEKTAAMFTYLKMIPLIPVSRKEFCLHMAKKVANHFHSLKKYHLALEAMESAFNVCSKAFDVGSLNLYLQMLLLNNKFMQVITTLGHCTQLDVKVEASSEGGEKITACQIPDDYVPELRIKLGVSLIHLRVKHLFDYLIDNIHRHIQEPLENIDLYVEVIEAFMQEEHYREAIALMEPIIRSNKSQCPAFIWLKHADCLRCLNSTEAAIASYYEVLKLAPTCYDAKFTIASLLKQQGRQLEALEALECVEDGESGPMHSRLLYERCMMLKQIGEIDEYMHIGLKLLGRNSLKLENREEMLAIANGMNFYNTDNLKLILQMRHIGEDADKVWQEFHKAQTESSDLSADTEFQLFLDLIRVAFDKRQFSMIERLCFAMATTKRFAPYSKDLTRITILACYFNNDIAIAFSYLRDIILKNANNAKLWNFLAILVQRGQTMRCHRFVRRFIQKCPVPAEVHLFLGHYHLQCSSYKYALNIYAPMFKMKPQPLIALCIAVAFNQISMQKKVLRKTAAVCQAICFAQKYKELRERELMAGSKSHEGQVCVATEEICYNIGRFYHQAGLMHMAIEYYERGLAVRHEMIEAEEDDLGLKQEIAYNLHLIYKSAGNLRKARDLLYRYCVV